MSAVFNQPLEARLEPMTLGRVPAVCAVEQAAFSHPWSATNFTDSLAAGYHCQCLIGPADPDHLPQAGASWPRRRPTPWLRAAQRPTGETLIGYFVAMKGVDEVHLLNLTVAPPFQGQGWAPMLLEALGGWARAQGAQWLWLEVRVSNLRALSVYERHGFRRVGMRTGYYPAFGNRREDAVVMSLRLNESPSAWGGLR